MNDANIVVQFKTEVWELELDDGRRLNLLENAAAPSFEGEEN